MFSEDDVTLDAFLGGKVRLYQPRHGYRAGVDPVLLAACVNARPGQTVLELGCGVGAASLCLSARIEDLRITGVERQDDYVALARRNAVQNTAPFAAITADICALPSDVRQMRFDHVIANPPYYQRNQGTAADNSGREGALGEDTPLEAWVSVAAKRLAPKGYAHFIHKAERLPDLLAACAGRLGSIEVLPLCARAGRKAELVILRARSAGRAPFTLHAPVILHEGATHERDGEDYAPLVRDVLRHGAALPFGDRATGRM